MKESKIRSRLIKALKAQGCAAWPVENAVAVGMPDIYGVWNGYPFWIELKALSPKLAKALRETSMASMLPIIASNNPASWKRQEIWRTKHAVAGGQDVYLALFNAKDLREYRFISMHKHATAVNDMLQNTLRSTKKS